MTYFDWFFKSGGWKRYILAFIVGIVISIVVALNIDWVNNPIIIQALIILTIIGYDIGVVYHSISIWKKNRA